MRKFLLLLLLLTLPALASAQWVGPITITSSQCATVGAEMNATVVAYVSGVWTGTLQPQGTIQGQAPFNVQATPSTSSTPQSTITASGAYQVSVAGYSSFQLCGATVASGTATVYLNASMASSGGSGGGGAASFTTLAGGTNNVNASHIEGTGSSMSASGTGQVAGSQLWLPAGLSAPSISFALAGGSFQTGRATGIRYVFNSALGSTVTSIATSGSNVSFGCSAGTTCQLTITAPTLPAGYTSYSVYAQDCGLTPCDGSEVLQAACTAITINCVLNSVGAGAAFPTTNTAYIQPSGVNANVCPQGVLPSLFVQKTDNTWDTAAGVDISDTTTGGAPAPFGTLNFCRRTFFNDVGTAPIPGKNAMVVMYHQAGVGTQAGNQDRTLYLSMTQPANDSATRYGLNVFQSEMTFTGTAQINGSPDGDITTGVFSIGDTHTGVSSAGAYGFHALRTLAVRNNSGTFSSCTQCYVGLLAQVTNGHNSNWGGGVAVDGTCGGGNFAGACAAFWAHTGSRATTFNAGYRVDDYGTNTADWNIFSASTNGTPTSGRNWFGGNVYFPNVITAAGTIGVTGSFSNTGSLGAAQLATPAAPTVSNIGTPGGTSYTYKLVAKDGNAKTSPASGATATPTGNATLDGTNFNRICLTSTAWIGTSTLDVYRTISGGAPASVGKIGVITPTNTTLIGTSFCLDDTGLAGDTTTPPTVNTTGGVTAAGYVTGGLNTVRVAANFTTAANTSLQTITGLSWNIPNGAANYSFHCALTYSQATAVVAVAFGVQAATIAPTNIFANGTQQITVGPPATFVTGTLATLATTTATNIVSGTPGAIATNYTAYLDGTLEQPAGSGNVLNIMVSTANSADLVTVLRGSFCSITP